MRSFKSLFFFIALSFALPSRRAGDCTGTISSLADVDAAVKCTTVNINSFTVPAGKTFVLSLLDGTTVNLNGNVKFGVKNWIGPLFQVEGNDITFNGNGFTFDGNGPSYWDGKGTNSGVIKPHPMMKIKISGVYSDVKVLNSPAQVYSVSNPGLLTMSSLNIDNSAGDQPNDASGNKAAGHNTDGFDASTTNLIIENSVVKNQDDCLAINKGSNITFTGNTCSGGHGISIGSISTGAIVRGITITNNEITVSDQALRIKTKAGATDASVSGITYSGNTASGIARFGVIIDQSYPDTLGKAGNGVTISDVSFIGPQNTISVDDEAQRVAVNCGSKTCSGTWDWSALSVSGGSKGTVNYNGITGFTQ